MCRTSMLFKQEMEKKGNCTRLLTAVCTPPLLKQRGKHFINCIFQILPCICGIAL